MQCKEGGFPHDLWLAVSAENVSVYKRGESKPLETFQYEHIVFFGAPQPSTYKITVDEREMFFETPMVNSHFDTLWCMQCEMCLRFFAVYSAGQKTTEVQCESKNKTCSVNV